MKKNKMMRLASVLMMAVLLTTSVIGGTFAKYTTSDEAKDTARVAKWGVTVAMSGSLYGEKYEQTGTKITAETADDKVSVWGKQATGTDAVNTVVAPGTSSDGGFYFSLDGEPEVDSLITVDLVHQNVFLGEGVYGVMVKVQGITAENFADGVYYKKTGDTYEKVTAWVNEQLYEVHDAATVASGGYWPVKYTLTGETGSISYTAATTTSDSLKAVADAIIAQLSTAVSTQDTTNKSKWTYATVTKAMEQNVDFETLDLSACTLSWIWEYSTDAASDKADTILGNLMAERINTADWEGDVVMTADSGTTYVQPTEGTNYCLDSYFDFKIRVEQTN